MNTRYRKPFTGTQEEFVIAARLAFPRGFVQFAKNGIFFVNDGVDVAYFPDATVTTATAWIKEVF